MKLTKIVSTLNLLLFTFTLLAHSQDAQPIAKQAQVIRSTTGRMLNEQGLAENTVPVRKGFTFDVVSETLSDVVLSHNGRKFKMAKSEVIISEKEQIIEEGRASAEAMIATAREDVARMVEQTAIVQAARDEAQRILDEARDVAEDERRRAEGRAAVERAKAAR